MKSVLKNVAADYWPFMACFEGQVCSRQVVAGRTDHLPFMACFEGQMCSGQVVAASTHASKRWCYALINAMSVFTMLCSK